ncbi:MAG: hypothetical protein U0Q15_04390 [Kineosporiaceae bacterium]
MAEPEQPDDGAPDLGPDGTPTLVVDLREEPGIREDAGAAPAAEPDWPDAGWPDPGWQPLGTGEHASQRTSDQSGPGAGPAEATNPTIVLPADDDEIVRAVPPPLYEQGDGITRALCAHAHLYHPMAKGVADGLLGGNYNAAAPVWGVDLVALMRHARESVQRWDARDQQLRWVTVSGFVIALFTAAIVNLGGLPWRVGLTLLFASPIYVFLASFLVVHQHYAGTRARAVAAMKDPTPVRDLAGAGLSPDDVAALEELATANVVAFAGSVPFVGDGRMLENWTLSIDLSRARRDPGAARPDGADVTASGLHHHVMRRLRQGPLSGVRVEQRLYARGGNARKIEGLCDGWTHARCHPRARIDPEVVDSFADAPAVFARTYVAAQRISWGGQLVVTLLLHARLHGTVLQIEASEHVLPPLKGRYAKVGDFPDGRMRVMRHTLAASWRSTGRLISQCWPRLAAARRNGRNWRRICRRNEKAHRDGVPFNYGASESLREQISDPGRMLYYALGDEVMSAVPLRRAALRAVAEYVEQFGYDVTDLREQEKQIDMVGVVRLSDAAAKLISMGAKS